MPKLPKVPAEWVGGYTGFIPGTGEYLSRGSVKDIYLAEAYGQTLLINPHDATDVTLVGFGHVAKAEHAGLSKAELEALGYRFEGASTNWKPLKKLEELDPADLQATQDLPTEADMSEYYHEPEPEAPATPEVQPDLEARKNDDGSISLITRLPAAPASDEDMAQLQQMAADTPLEPPADS